MTAKKEKTEKELLGEMNQKLDLLVIVTALNGKEKKEQIKILRTYKGPFSKRDLEKITGVDRHEF